MPKYPSPNPRKKYKRIKEQFETMIAEKTTSGASPSSSSVVEHIADIWCISEARVRAILNMELEQDTQTKLFE